jgi:hypothetical protein
VARIVLLKRVELGQHIVPEPDMMLELAVAEAQAALKLHTVLELRAVLVADSDPLELEHHMALEVVHMAQEEHSGGLAGLSFALGTCHPPSGAVLGHQ